MAGRLREYDRDQIAEDLIEWAKKPDSINLNKFCCSHDTPFPPSKITVWSNEDPEFRQSVEIAKSFLGARREEWLNKDQLHIKGYDLNASTYDYFLKEEKRAQAEFESKLKTQENAAYDEKALSQHEALMKIIKMAQDDRSIADKVINADAKS